MIRIVNWLRRKKNTNDHLVQDVFSEPRKRYLDLSHHARLIEFHSEIFRAFVKNHRKQLALIFAVFIGMIALVSAPQSGASLASFTPTTCLGGWQNPQNATGLPTVPDGSPPEKYTIGNSAVLKDVAPLYCGQFSGSIPHKTIPNRFVLSFHWSVDDGSVVHPIPEPIDDGGGVPEFPIVETSSDVLDEQISEDEEKNSESVESITTPIEVIEVPAGEDVPETESASVIRRLVRSVFSRTVFAQEEESVFVSDSETVPEMVPETVPETVSEIAPEITSEPVSSFGDFLMIRYTLDGSVWRDLGTVSMASWGNAQFEIRDADLATWDDVSRLQIALEPIVSIDTMPAVYLDAMRITVSFEDVPETELPPTIDIFDSGISIIASEKDIFASAEAPVFDIVNPNLSKRDITKLLDEKKATVIEDRAGVYGAPTEHDEKKEKHQKNTPILERIKNSIETIVPETNVAQAQSVIDVAPAIDIVILDALGEETAISAMVERVVVDGETRNRVRIEKPGRSFRPGKFSIKVTLHTPDALLVSRQDFSWGVLAVNVDKSIYAPGDEAYVQMGVLDDFGHTICDAILYLRIEGPGGFVVNKRTSDGSIVQDPECGPDNVISVPDYHSRVSLPETPGVYTMRLAATTVNGTRTLVDSFEIRTAQPFVITRTGPTRIFPLALYPVTMTVQSESAWEGTVIERVPASFIISAHPDALEPATNTVTGDVRVLTWNLDISAGGSRRIGYYFDAPDISPEFHVLGPASLYSGSGTSSSSIPVFEEARQWQIASDAICTSQVTTGNWSDAGTWNCGRVPNSADSAVIAGGHTITLDMDAVGANALLDVTVNGTLDASSLACASGARSCDVTTRTLTIGASGVYSAGTNSTITLTSTSATTLTFTTGATFNAGTSTVILTGGVTVTVNSTAITGSNALYNFIINGAGPKNLGGALEVINDTTVTLGALDVSNANNYPLTSGRIIIANSASATFNPRAATITLTATSGTLFTKGASGVLNSGTSNFVIASDADITFLSGNTSFRNITFAPVLTGNRTHLIGSIPTVTSATLTVNPSGTGTLTVSPSSTTAFGGTSNLLVKATGGSATGKFDTTSSNFDITFGTIGLDTGGEIVANGSTITLSATAGPLLNYSGSGVFNAGTSTVIMTAGLSITINTAGYVGSNSLYNLTINGSGNKLLGGAIGVLNDLTVTLGTLDVSNTDNYPISAGRIIIANSGSANISARAATITLTATSGTLFTKGASGVFNSATSNVVIASDADITFLSGNTTFRDVTFAPVLTGNRTHLLGSIPTLTSGTLTINPSGSGTLTVSPNATLTFGGTSNLLVKATGGSAVGKFDTTTSNYGVTFARIGLDTGGEIVANNSVITLVGTTAGPLLSHAGTGLFNAGTSTVTITSGVALTLNTSGYTGSSKLYNLTFNGSGIKTLGAGLEVENLTTITLGTLDTNNTSNFPFTTGNLVLASSASAGLNTRASVITFTGTSGTLFTRGISGTFNPATAEYVVASPSGTPTFLSTALTLHAVTIDSTATVINSGAALTIANAGGAKLYIKNGVFNDSGFGITTPGSTVNTLQIDAGGTLCLGGASGANTSATCDTSATSTTARGLPAFSSYSFDPGSTIIYLSNAALSATHFPNSPTYGTIQLSPVLTANRTYDLAAGTTNIAGSLTILPAGTANTLSVNMAGTVLVSETTTIARSGSNALATLSTNTSNPLSTGRLVVGGGACTGASCTFTAGSSTVTLTGTSGNLFTLGTGGVFNAGTSSVVVSGNGDAVVNSGTIAFYAFSQTGTGVKTLGGPISIAGSQALTVSAGVFDPVSFLVTGSGSNTLSVASGATIRVGASTFAGNYSAGFTTRTLSSGSTVDYTLAGTQTIDSTLSYSNLTTSGASGTKTLSGNTTVGAVLSLDGGAVLDTGADRTLSASKIIFNGGTLSANSSAITVTGTDGNPIVHTSGSLTGTSTITVTGNNASGNSVIAAVPSYYNLRLNNGSETYVAGGSLAVTGVLTVMAGTFNLDTYATTFGSIDIDSGATLLGGNNTATLSGSWNNDGTFTANTSTIAFTGPTTATISGSTNFYNLTISHTSAKEVNFSVSGSPIFGVSNHFIATGTGAGLIKLYSTSGGTRWQFNPTGTSYIRYVDVKDGGCEIGANMMTVVNSTDSGNNESCWAFSTLSFTLSTSISDATIGFGSLSSTAPKFCTADEAGSYTEVEAHTIAISAESSGGYILTVQGSSLSNGTHTIAPIGSSNIGSIPGTEQFGLRAVATGGAGVVESLYSGSGFGFPASAATVPSVIAQSAVGDGETTTYSMRYIANISSTTPAGAYSTNLTYVVTGTF